MPNYPNAVMRHLWEKTGEAPSVLDFGAKGDVQILSIAVTSGSAVINATFPAGGGFTDSDVGKRIVIYGAAASGRETYVAGTPGGILTGNAYAGVCSMDAQAGTQVKFAGNCSTNDVTWEIFGADAADFSDEVSISGPTDITALEASISYSTSASKRYYRVKAKSKTSGQAGLAYASMVTLGYILGAHIVSVASPTQCTLSIPAETTRENCYGYFGTDDTAAIQTAMDSGTSFVTPNTADGGLEIRVPRGNYLISSPIDHKHGVVFKGHSGGGSIFYVDGADFPIDTPVWNMTGTFAVDSRIAFFTRLEDIRIDCGHVPGSTAVFCDALQENSGLYRCTLVQWGLCGIQACSDTNRYGCVNWIISDPWIYPSITAFLDANVRGIQADYALDLVILRGTVLGQAGYICGYGKAIEVSHGVLTCIRVHLESAEIGIHFNTGSDGTADSVSTQSFVQIGVQMDGHTAVVRNLQAAGQKPILDNIGGVTLTGFTIPFYVSTPRNEVIPFVSNLQMAVDKDTYPNVVTWNTVNFGTEYQGGMFSVNSKIDSYPDWIKTSGHSSDKAMFMRLAAAAFEIMIGLADNSNGTDPGTRYLKVDDIMAGLFTPRLYFDTDLGIGPLDFGNNIDVNRSRWWHGGGAQNVVKLQRSTDSGANWVDVILVDLAAGTVTITGLQGVGTTGFTGTITTAKRTTGGAEGSMTFVNGLCTAQVQAT